MEILCKPNFLFLAIYNQIRTKAADKFSETENNPIRAKP
jgi:hypothetical protein